MAVRGIEYCRGKHDTYKYVYLEYSDKTRKIFLSGNFTKDWYNCTKWFFESELDEVLSDDVSVDEFIIDGAPYDSAYLKFNDEKLPYFDYICDWENRGLEMFVDKNTQPTWDEYKNLIE